MLSKLKLFAVIALKEVSRNWGQVAVSGSSLFVCLVSVLLLLSVTRSFKQELSLSAKEMLGADYVISSKTKPSEEALRTTLAGFESELVQTNTMLAIKDAKKFRVAQVRGIDERYPIYGSFKSKPQIEVLADSHQAVLDESLVRQLGLKLGDQFSIGKESFTFAAILEAVPGEVNVFGMVAPRVYVSLKKLKSSGLLDFGSQARYRFFFRGEFPKLDSKLSEQKLELETAADRASSSGRLTGALEKMIQFVALLILALGSLGFSVALQFDLTRRSNAIRPLYLLGVRNIELKSYLLIGSVLRVLVVSIAGIVFSNLLLPLIQDLLSTVSPTKLLISVDWHVFFLVLSLSLFIAIWSSVTFQVSLLVETKKTRDLLIRVLVPVFVSLILAAVFLQDLSLFIKVLATLSGLVLITYIILKLISFFLEKLSGRLGYAEKFGILMITRRSDYYLLTILTLALTTTSILSAGQFKNSILEQLRSMTSDERANSFLFDVQTSQIEGVVALARKHELLVASQVSVLTMRLAKVEGELVTANKNPKRATWALRREYRATNRASLLASEKVIAGEYVGSVSDPTDGLIPLSIEGKMATDLDVKLGSILTFEIQGVPFDAVVSSIRHVDWKSGEINFFITFPEGVLQNTPRYFALLARFRSADQFVEFEKELNDSFANVSVIDLRELLKGAEAIFGVIGQISSVLALIVMALGLSILATTLAGLGASKTRIDNLLRQLGASPNFLIRTNLLESAIIALQGAIVGFIGYLAFTEVVIVSQMELPRHFKIGQIVITVILLALVPFLLGILDGIVKKKQVLPE